MLNDAFAQVAESLQRSTVQVQTRRRGIGSGVIWRSTGLIITNSHVVRGQSATVRLSDGRNFTAPVTARNSQRDLAALQIDATDLPAIAVGIDPLRVGELVFAVGHPRGEIGAVTAGIIHTVAQSWIQADIRLAPGNSGGALANAAGNVIGINTMIANGLGLAIPSRTVERFLETMGDRPYLGVTLQFVRVAIEGKPAFGLLISEIESGSPAEAVLLPGDVLIGVRGVLFGEPNELFWILENSNSGDELQIDLLRGGQRTGQNVILNSRDSTSQAA